MIYRFGPFELDAGSGALRRSGRPIALAAKPTELLLLLVRKRHQLVTRNEIISALWPEVHVSDAAVASVLRDLRRALGERGGETRYVETLRRRGLRFLAPVEEIESVPPAGVRSRPPYVGRADLLARCHHALQAAAAGTGGVVLLDGAPGVGKTRTAHELAARARAAGAQVYVGYCGASFAPPPYHPWVRVLDALVASLDPTDLEEALGSRAADVARWVPSLCAADAPQALEADEDARQRLFDGVLACLRRAAQAAPLVVVLEDLHRADRPTLRLLEFVAGAVASDRILLVGTYRSTGLPLRHPLLATLTELERCAWVEREEMRALDTGEARAFVRMCATRAIAEAEVDVLCRRSDGNPFFLLQLVHAYEAAGDGAPGHVPASVREWVWGQLAGLSAVAGDCLRAAAVLGDSLSLPLLARVVGAPAERVFEALEEARQAALVTERSHRRFHFVHALVAEAIYAATPLPRRMQLHRAAGEALLASSSADRGELLAAVADHLCEAVELVGLDAVEAASRAADFAESRLAYEEAVRLRGRALDALERVDPAGRGWRARLLLGQARAQLGAGELALACETARSAAAVAREVGDTATVAEAALVLAEHRIGTHEATALLEEALPKLATAASPRLRARLLCALANELWYDGPLERRLALAEEAEAIGRAAGDRLAIATALLAKRNARFAPAYLAERIRLASEAYREAERGGHTLTRCLALWWRATDLLESGDLLAAQRDVDLLEHVVASGRARRLLPAPSRWRAMIALLQGRWDDAERCIGEAAQREQEAGDFSMLRGGRLQLVLLLREQDRRADLEGVLARAGEALHSAAERIPSVRAAVALFELEAGRSVAAHRVLDAAAAGAWAALDRDPVQLALVSWLAELCARTDAAERAAALYERCRAYADRFALFHAIDCRGSMARYLGLLARTAGRLDAAEACFSAAVAANRQLGAEPYAAWSLHEWAGTLRRRGRPGDVARARELAAEARRSAEQLRLRRLLAAMEADPP